MLLLPFKSNLKNDWIYKIGNMEVQSLKLKTKYKIVSPQKDWPTLIHQLLPHFLRHTPSKNWQEGLEMLSLSDYNDLTSLLGLKKKKPSTIKSWEFCTHQSPDNCLSDSFNVVTFLHKKKMKLMVKKNQIKIR